MEGLQKEWIVPSEVERVRQRERERESDRERGVKT
jgi:hypothetical protein